MKKEAKQYETNPPSLRSFTFSGRITITRKQNETENFKLEIGLIICLFKVTPNEKRIK